MPRNSLARHESPAQRQKAYRERLAIQATKMDRLVDAVIHALDRGRCSKFADNLPEEKQARIEELTSRLEASRLIACKREENSKVDVSDHEDSSQRGFAKAL